MCNNIFKLIWRVYNFLIFIKKTSLNEVKGHIFSLTLDQALSNIIPIMEDFDWEWWVTDGIAPQLQTQHINKRSSLGRSRWRERCDPSWRPGSPMPRRGTRTHTSVTARNTAADPEHQPTTPVCLLEETFVTCPQTCETLDWGGNIGPNNQWIVRFSWFTASLY